MPHDMNTHEIRVGDWIRVKPLNNPDMVVGRVVKIRNSLTCSGEVRWQGIGQLDQDYFDAAAALIVLGAEGNVRADPADVTAI